MSRVAYNSGRQNKPSWGVWHRDPNTEQEGREDGHVASGRDAKELTWNPLGKGVPVNCKPGV